MGCKIVAINSQEILGMFRLYEGRNVTILPELPEGYIVQACQFDFSTNCYMFRVFHESWPEVDEGQVPEIISGVRQVSICITQGDAELCRQIASLENQISVYQERVRQLEDRMETLNKLRR